MTVAQMCTEEGAYLLHVVEVLHAGRLAQIDAVGNVLAQHECADQMVSVTSLACTHDRPVSTATDFRKNVFEGQPCGAASHDTSYAAVAMY